MTALERATGKTPAVLLLVFRRPDTTRQVMDAIRRARPPRLYVAADGPREAAEAPLCAETRRIATAVDWPCELKTLFRESNLGTRHGISTAIDWFFAQEEAGIVLEDDCLPDPSFFSYCAELLSYYADDRRIMAISGNTYRDAAADEPCSYAFSRYPFVWGWATWRRAWRLYDAEMKSWPEARRAGVLKAWSDGEPEFERYWSRGFDAVAAYEVEAWDYVWVFSCWMNNGLACIPNRNLVSNIGFGSEATHTVDPRNPLARRRTHAIELPLRHPRFVVRNADADREMQRDVYSRRRSLLGRLLRLARR